MSTVLLGSLAAQLVTNVDAALDAAGDPVGRAFVAPGQAPAWDDCCEGGGQLWARIVLITPHSDPRRGAASTMLCGISWLEATIGVGVIRCAHTVDDNGSAPTSAELSSDGLRTIVDSQAILEAAACTPLTGAMKLDVVRWEPLGPQGGCVGGEWQFTVHYDHCLCPPEETT